MSGERAPKGLGPAGRRLWREMTREWELSEDSLTLLRQACASADTCDRLQEAAAAAEPVIQGRLGQLLPNPVFTELRGERRLLLALLLALREPVAEIADDYSGLRVAR